MDFRKFTRSSDFDQEKINNIIRLSNIKGYVLYQSEIEYLQCYRDCLAKEHADPDFGEPMITVESKGEEDKEKLKPSKKKKEVESE